MRTLDISKANRDWLFLFLQESNLIERVNTPRESFEEYLKTGIAENEYIPTSINAAEYVIKNKSQVPTFEQICELHGKLMKGHHPEAGKIRTRPVYIRKSQINLEYLVMADYCSEEDLKKLGIPPYNVTHKTMPEASELHGLLENWLNLWGKKPRKSWSKGKVCLYRHYEFERIHPFIDGNGRIGRLLLWWDTSYHGAKKQIIFDENKHDYYNALDHYDSVEQHELKWS
jgi:Fic family protein